MPNSARYNVGIWQYFLCKRKVNSRGPKWLDFTLYLQWWGPRCLWAQLWQLLLMYDFIFKLLLGGGRVKRDQEEHGQGLLKILTMLYGGIKAGRMSVSLPSTFCTCELPQFNEKDINQPSAATYLFKKETPAWRLSNFEPAERRASAWYSHSGYINCSSSIFLMICVTSIFVLIPQESFQKEPANGYFGEIKIYKGIKAPDMHN